MDQLGHFKGSTGFGNNPEQSTSITQCENGLKQQIGCEEKKAAVDEEMARMNKLPPNSTYATHRLKVLNKILQLLSIQRTTSQDQELELLFAGLSI